MKETNDFRQGLLRNRNFLDYFGMNLSSRSGGQVGNIAIIWLVFSITHSALAIAIIGIAETLATILMTLPAGVWVDRYNRRFLLSLSNTIRTICLLLLVIFTTAFGFTLVAIVAIVFVWNAATEIYRSTDYSVLPDLVSSNDVANANGVTRAGYQLIGSASNVLGGALVAFVGATLAFVYGAGGYALATIFSIFLLYRFRSQRPVTTNSKEQKRHMGKEIKEGLQWLVTQRGLFLLSLSAVAFNFLNGMPFYFLVIYVGVGLKAGAFVFGGVTAAFVVGRALGSLLVGRTNALAHTGKAWILLYGAGTGTLLIVLGLFPNTEVAIIASLVAGISGGFGGNVWLTSAQNLVPSPMRGRYFAIDGLLSFIGGPPAIVLGGILITSIGILPVYIVSGIVSLLFALIFSLMKSLWTLDGRGIGGAVDRKAGIK